MRRWAARSIDEPVYRVIEVPRLLQKNPLTMVGTLDRCWLLVYRTPIAESRRWLPDGLELVTYGDYAF